MSKAKTQERSASERRKFERVDIARQANVPILDGDGKKVGTLLQLGRGGFMMEPEQPYSTDGKTHELMIYEPDEEIRVPVRARVLYADPKFVGFEFVDLGADAAVEIGIIIGKHYETRHENPHD